MPSKPPSQDGHEQLTAAAVAGDAKRIKALLAAGADIRAGHPQGNDLLGLAASDRGLPAMEVLVAAGAKAEPGSARSPWLLALSQHATRWEVYAALLAAGADVNERDSSHCSALDMAILNHRGLALIDHLLAAGATLNPSVEPRRSPIAAAIKDPDLLQALIARGLDVNAPRKVPGISIATESGQHQALEILLAAGADPEARCSSWMPPIAYAQHINTIYATTDDRAANLLIKAGAQPFRELDASTIDEIPVDRRQLNLLKCASRGFMRQATALLDLGVDVDCAAYEGGPTAAHSATRRGDLPFLRLLAERGADLDRPGPDSWTPLKHALSSGAHECVEYLLERGASPWFSIGMRNSKTEHITSNPAISYARCEALITTARQNPPAQETTPANDLDTEEYAALHHCRMNPSSEIIIVGIAPHLVLAWLKTLIERVVAQREHHGFNDLVVTCHGRNHLLHLQGDSEMTYLGQEERLPYWVDTSAVVEAAVRQFKVPVKALSE